MILVIDNYDSFTFNLVHYLMELGAEVEVVRNDAISAGQALSSGAKGLPDLARPVHAQRSRESASTSSPPAPTPRGRCSACASGTRRSASTSAGTSPAAG
jgi:hypothetical protein